MMNRKLIYLNIQPDIEVSPSLLELIDTFDLEIGTSLFCVLSTPSPIYLVIEVHSKQYLVSPIYPNITESG